jgi:hypothetical protein
MTAKLSKKVQRDLASRINSIMVSCEMIDAMFKKNDIKTAKLFQDQYFKEIVSLFDNYGIKLPAYDIAVNYL